MELCFRLKSCQNTRIRFLGATADNTGFGRQKVCHLFSKNFCSRCLHSQHPASPHCDQEFKWKLTSVANHKLEVKLCAQVSNHNYVTCIYKIMKESTFTAERTQKPSSYLRGIDGQSLQQEPAGIQMKTIMNQEVSKIDQRDILIFTWRQIKCFLQTGDSKGAISNRTPVQSSFIKHKPQRIFWL